jgi:hypothetical protein
MGVFWHKLLLFRQKNFIITSAANIFSAKNLQKSPSHAPHGNAYTCYYNIINHFLRMSQVAANQTVYMYDHCWLTHTFKVSGYSFSTMCTYALERKSKRGFRSSCTNFVRMQFVRMNLAQTCKSVKGT